MSIFMKHFQQQNVLPTRHLSDTTIHRVVGERGKEVGEIIFCRLYSIVERKTEDFVLFR